MSSVDYFALFGLPQSFDIQQADLEKRYFEAQRKFHPDRIVGKSAVERVNAISESMRVNSAYEILKSPLRRANYMLSLQGIAQDKAKPSQALIMEVMELRERLAETENTGGLQQMEAENTRSRDAALLQLSQAFRDHDFPLASEIATRLSYISKMQDEIRARMKVVREKA